MIIDRRAFIQVSVQFVATAAALATLPVRLPSASSRQLACGNQDMQHPAFKIHGWDCRDESTGDGSKTSPTASVKADSSRNEIFISINQSWRTAWR
jgi:hypothetical protein